MRRFENSRCAPWDIFSFKIKVPPPTLPLTLCTKMLLHRDRRLYVLHLSSAVKLISDLHHLKSTTICVNLIYKLLKLLHETASRTNEKVTGEVSLIGELDDASKSSIDFVLR